MLELQFVRRRGDIFVIIVTVMSFGSQDDFLSLASSKVLFLLKRRFISMAQTIELAQASIFTI
jgi:hypothetical protein